MMQTQAKIYRPAGAFIRQNWPLVLFGLAHAVIFLAIFQHYFGYASHDNFIEEYTYALKMGYGQLPYRDFAVEYPPLAMLIAFIPRLISAFYNTYLQAYIVEMLIFDLIGVWAIWAIARELALNRWKVLGIYTIAVLAIGPLITVRFDIIPAVITLLALYAFIRGHHKTAWALLAVGTLVKIYPVILAPLFLLYYLRGSRTIKASEIASEEYPGPRNDEKKEKSSKLNSASGYFLKRALTGLAAFAITSAIFLVPALILSPSGLWHVIAYHMQRPLQIESVYASVLELLYGFKLITLRFVLTFGSVNLVSPLADLMAKISFVVMVLGMAAVYLSFYRSLKDKAGTERWASLVRHSLLIVLVFALTSKVLSAQYIIWFPPLIPLVTGKWRNTIWLLFITAGLMTFFIYPEYYDGIRHGQLLVIAMLAGRNVVLIMIAAISVRAGNSPGPEGEGL